MIALEALKNEVTLLTDDLSHLNRRIQSVESKIDRNSAEIDENNS
jgi:peptidoglycan hydrolase CwlO-like protein